MNSAAALSAGLVAIALTACAGKTKQAGGLELILTTDVATPATFDVVHVEIDQETPGGGWASPLLARDYAIPDEIRLPTTISLAAGSSSDQNVLITITAYSGSPPKALIQRVVQTQVPTDRVAEVTLALVAACENQVGACGSGDSCQPQTGICGPNVVVSSGLSAYSPSDAVDAGIMTTPAPNGSSSGTGTASSGSTSGTVATSGTLATSGVAAPSGSAATSGSAGSTASSGSSVIPPDAGTRPNSSVVPASDVVLDDMSVMKSAGGGFWYTFSDRLLPDSIPPILQPGKADTGSITPTEGSIFLPTMASADSRAPRLMFAATGQTMPVSFREASGGGESVWGCGFGLDLVDTPPDGGAVAVNSCMDYLADAGVSAVIDSSGKNPNVSLPLPFDVHATRYTGIAFYGTSFGSTEQVVVVQMDDERTSLWGGVCDVCLNGGRCSAESDGGRDCPCADNFSISMVFPVGEWQRFSFHFTDAAFETENWSGQDLAQGSIDTSHLYDLHFMLATTSGEALPNFDVGVAYITWLTD